jgi:hypothetical protein
LALQRCVGPQTEPGEHVESSVQPGTQKLVHAPPQNDSHIDVPPSAWHCWSEVQDPLEHVQSGGTGPAQYCVAVQSLSRRQGGGPPSAGIMDTSGPASMMAGQLMAGQLPATQKPPPLQSAQGVGDWEGHDPLSPRPFAASASCPFMHE